jgi:hypothetical protein
MGQNSSVYDLQHRVELRPIPGKGQGVFSARDFQAGDTLCVGVIQRILNRNDHNATQIGLKRYVLLAGLINEVNHSCTPNCGIKANNVGGFDLVAMKDGNRNEEITFDYAMQNYNIEYFTQKCACGSSECRGEITGWKDLSLNKKEAYKNFVAPYLLELDQIHEH